MDIHKHPDNVDINTRASDDNDEKDESSDNDDDSDESQPCLMTPFDINEVQREIIKEDFIGKWDVSSHLFENDKDEKVADLFGDIFGLHDIYSDSGYQITEEEAHVLFQYFIDLNQIEVINIPSLKISLELERISQIIDDD